MEVWVQSKHLLHEELLLNIWRRSATDECFNDWRRRPQTDLGAFSSDSLFFWANWLCTNKGLIPVFNLNRVSELKEWRIIVILDDTEKSKSVVIKENESSVYVYQLLTSELTRFRFVRSDKPQLFESQVNEIPEWLLKKIAVAKEERPPNAHTVESRLNVLTARLEQFKQRRKNID